ncbi:hypothetical protein GMORB2_4047 [Geosmithia morbida]|uniref:Methyltransferase n=1 Tax=Geosmithia morbida TaxID=1094350 RepID=A0A9P5D2L4_9HYPO|nr:uncharacterized protein GMORB2_4047 [Geosmithia morbida]KAF4125208.1 hypothetical protein GMORB2_4047 [Geosmithia morbida]
MSGGQGSLPVISTIPDPETFYTPSVSVDGWSTDGFEFLQDDSEYVDEDGNLVEVASEYSSSVSPSIYDHEFKHGRRYHSYKSGRYPVPNDQYQQQLEELKHHIAFELMGGLLFSSEIDTRPRKILDIGTGAVADRYPGASIIGTDLSPIQPTWAPPNLEMFVDDCEDDEWLDGSGFDLVHLRDVDGFLRNPGAVIAQAYKSGGWIEFQDCIPIPYCDDDSMKDDDPLKRFSELVKEGMHKLGCTLHGSPRSKESLEEAGFTNVQLTVKKVPIGAWPQDEKLRCVGLLMSSYVSGCLGGYAAKPFEALKISPAEREALIRQVTTSLEDRRIHRYARYSICYGQKESRAMDLRE